MQMTVDRDALLKVLSVASSVPAGKDTLPILQYFLLGGSGETGFVRATDLDLEIRAPFEAEINAAGEICVAAKVFYEIVKRLPAKSQIGLTLIDERLKIVCGKSQFQLSTLPAEDHPPLEVKANKSWQFEIEASVLRGMLTGVRHAVANDEARYYLNGIYLHLVSRERLAAVATNGHLLAMQCCDAPPQTKGLPGVILPRKTIGELIKILPNSGDLVSLTVSKKLVELELGNGMRLCSKVVDGTFPDYERVIPKDSPYAAFLSADELSKAVARVSSVLDSNHTGVTIALAPGKTIKVAAERGGIGSGFDHFAAEIEEGKAEIGFNYRYLLDILGSLEGGAIEIKFTAASDPIVIGLKESTDIVNVLMPMRVNASTGVLEEAA